LRHLLAFIHRHEPRGETLAHLKSAIGAIVALTLVGGLAAWTGLPMLLAPFGASAVLLFGQPNSPFSQPANVFGGYLVAAAVTAAVLALLPGAWWAATIATGLIVGLMLVLRVTHPPSGAIPLVAFGAHMAADTLFFVILAGSLCMLGVAVVHHRIPPRVAYPRPIED
jgi:CBS-domain-containing membrane protein